MISGFGSAAAAFNGSIIGSVDGHAVDVPVVCNREKLAGGEWLQVQSDPNLQGIAEDSDGDGIAVVISADLGQGRALFSVLVAGEIYTFSARRELQITDAGLAIQSTVEEFEGMNTTPIRSYAVDLVVDCPKD